MVHSLTSNPIQPNREMGNIPTPSPGLFLLLLLIFCSTTLLISSTQESIVCHPNDSAALLEFKAAFPPEAFPAWDAALSCCVWEGITCSRFAPHRVTGLNVSSQVSVRGSIPPAIGDLEFLQHITFIHLPNLMGSIPRELTKLKSLRSLYIAHTSLSTPIPSFIEELQLQELVLRQNNHSGPIPPRIVHNRIGQVSLDLSKNQLSGPIPLDFGNVDFGSIDLSWNLLTGDASFLFGRSKLVRRIDLSRNQLDFELTNVVFPEPNLSILRLNHNNIRAIIPSQIANVSNLSTLDLSHNQLCCMIPIGGFGPSSYSNNLCLCGTPLPPCPWNNHAFSA